MADNQDYASDFGFENYEDFDFGIGSVSQEEYDSAKEDVTTAVGASSAGLEKKITDLATLLKKEIETHDHEDKLDELIALQKAMKVDELLKALSDEMVTHDPAPKINEILKIQQDMKTSLDKQSNEIQAVKDKAIKDVNEKLRQVERLIMPLMFNLMKNPENPYIKWPGRKLVIEKQVSKILKVTRGK